MNGRSHWVTWLVLVMTICPDSALARYVVVNGERVTDADLAYLDQISCSRVPDGH